MPTCRSNPEFSGRKFIFVHVPKTAGVSMSATLEGITQPYEGDLELRKSILDRSFDLVGRYQGVLFWHITADDLRAHYGNDQIDSYYSFAFVRNPWDWLVSMYAFIREHKEHPESMICGHMSFKVFLRYFIAKNVTQHTFFASQGRLAVSRVFRFEDLPRAIQEISGATGIEFPEFPVENKSDHQAFRSYYDSEDVAAVREHFAEDIAIGGYEFDSGDWNAGADSPLGEVLDYALEAKEVQIDLDPPTDVLMSDPPGAEGVREDAMGEFPASTLVAEGGNDESDLDQCRVEDQPVVAPIPVPPLPFTREKIPSLILHVGTHKTGSTAIQIRLASASDRSLANFTYLRPQPIYSVLMEQKSMSSEIATELRRYFEQAINRDPRDIFVVSFEGFSGYPYDGYLGVGAISETLFSATDGLFDTTVILYLRRQDHFIESIYSQLAKNIVPPNFSSFLRSLPADSFRWDRFVAAWRETFGRNRVRVLIYDKATSIIRGGIFNEFCTAAGLDAGRADGEPDRIDNPSFSREAIDVVRLLGDKLDGSEFSRLRRVLETFSAVDGRATSLFSREERLGLMETFEESNDAVRREYFPDRDRLFPIVLDDFFKETYSGLDVNLMAQMLMSAVKVLKV